MDKNTVPKAKFVNTKKEFKWRLEMGREKSPWCAVYSYLLQHTFKNGETWYLGTEYWNETFPVETPFRISIK